MKVIAAYIKPHRLNDVTQALCRRFPRLSLT